MLQYYATLAMRAHMGGDVTKYAEHTDVTWRLE